MNRILIIMIAMLALSLAAFAQPAPTISWLRVSVQNSDGTPFPVVPTVSLVMPVDPVNQNNVPKADGLDIIFLDLTPGTYGVNITLRGTSLVIPQQTVEISQGANIFVWKLDPPITVSGNFTLDGKTPVAIKHGLAYDINNAGAIGGRGMGMGRIRQPRIELDKTFKVTTEGKYTFNVPAPGIYNLKFYTDKGYCDNATFTIPADTKASFTAPFVTLTSGGIIKFTLNDAKGKPVPDAVVYVTYSYGVAGIVPTRASYAAPSLTLGFTADDNGMITTPQLPVGQWSYNATSQLLVPNPPIPVTMAPATASGTVSVTLDTVADILVSLQ
ncbi:MAG: hypothetical protein WCJ56_03095 [bacterium]